MTAAELVIEAARVHTLTGPDGSGDGSEPTHVAIAGDRILAVGDADAVSAFVDSRTERLTFPGATLMPGWSDGHCHPVWGLEMTAGTILLQAGDLDQAKALLRADLPADGASGAPSGTWVLGWGLTADVFTDQSDIAGRVFDDVAAGRPLYLRFRDGHSGLANDAALAVAGITGAEEFAGASQIVVGADGRPTGHLLEMEAMARLESHIHRGSLSERAGRLGRLFDSMADRGLTSLQVLDANGDPFELCTELERVGELPLTVRFSPLIQPGVTDSELARWVRLQGTGGRRWRVEGVKLMLDGTVEGGTAWLEHPDLLGESTRPLWLPPEEYQRVVLHFARQGIPTATHAIGDRAVEFALETLATLPEELRRSATHRIEHIETLPEATIARMAELGVVASVQPIHALHLHPDGRDSWSVRLGAERAARAIPIRSLVEAGVPVVLGSDWPVADFDPFKGFAAAVARAARTLDDGRVAVPDQSIDRWTALRGYTSTSAIVRGDGEHTGRIEPGLSADLTLVEGDPLTMTVDELQRVTVLATWVGGRMRRVAGGGA
ncbi:amidohydrolase [Herbiconiux moechotypicola]|uniref:amidohydrolase n=1 Tax=Herbiconiux moechotypicola TaxID=637393 RepID=UPI00217E998D|nr:amidohydrolase [Herbiconiux moechotypicola]MCS5730667.1 amidohydrolase [Herbiconiux moechotypicola]